VLWGWWASIAVAAWKLAERFPPLSNLSFRTISIDLSMASLLGLAHLFLLWGVGFVSAGWAYSKIAPMMWTYLLNWNRFGIEILLYGFVFGIVGVLQYRMRAQKDAMYALELQQQLSAAHLRALQMQLEPHVLFNTLNAITTLVELGRQKQAAEMLRHLNAILKSTLQRNMPEKVPLSQELEILESYLAIEQVRFADRLRLDIRVDPAALDGLVPCFLLQPSWRTPSGMALRIAKTTACSRPPRFVMDRLFVSLSATQARAPERFCRAARASASATRANASPTSIAITS
jgi:Histidine kinase